MATATTLFIFIFFNLFLAQYVVADFVIYSDPPQSMLPGQDLSYDMTPHGVPFGPHVLAFEKDCTVVLYNLGKKVWATNTSRANGADCYLSLLPDGELILRHNFHYPIWRSGVKSTPGEYMFILRWDGGLHIYGPKLWSNTDEVTMSNPSPMVTTTDYVQYTQQVTTHTYGTILDYKNFKLVLREDCNLVLSNTDTNAILWQTGVYSDAGDCFTFIDSYGEFFVKHRRREILWRTGTRAAVPAVYPESFALTLRYDGRLMIYGKQIWSLTPPASAMISAI